MMAGGRLETRRVRMEADVLLNEVRRETEVVKRIEAETPGASGHSRVTDTVAALDTVEAAVQQLVTKLGRE